ncbi:MAG: sulfotransferase [Gammaproteobacteria bacterium]|nr:sulfotransferase [Gammaproteobacteria bacterium]
MPDFPRHRHIFIAGLHRSGTSLLHQIMRAHPLVSGFSDTGAPEDEGQHLQTVYKTDEKLGGPGRFARKRRAYMNEGHPLARSETASRLMAEWGRHWDLRCPYLIEKSPTNLIRMRFLQKLFPGARFVVILRHPLAVAYATRKWSRASLKSLLHHTLHAYELAMIDLPHLRHACVLRYEELVAHPQHAIDRICAVIGLPPVTVTQPVTAGINERYFECWEQDRGRLRYRWRPPLSPRFEARANALGYSLHRPTRPPARLVTQTRQSASPHRA